MMKNRVMLSLRKPDILTNPYITDRLAIVQAHSESKEWFLSSFYSFWIHKEPLKHKEYWGDLLYHGSYRLCPFIFEGVILRELVMTKWNGKVIDFVMDIIDSGQYIYMNINASCIECYRYKEENQMHDILIFGYDKGMKAVLAADFFGGEYQAKEIPFEQFEQAFHIEQTKKKDFLNGIGTLKYVETSYPFQVSDCIKGLEDYVNARNTQVKSLLVELDNPEEVYYGIDCYDGFEHYLMEIKNTGEDVEYRQFHYFYAHKVHMRKRIEYLLEKQVLGEESQDILESFKEVELFWQGIRNSILRYNMKKDDSFFDNVPDWQGAQNSMLRHNMRKNNSFFDNMVERLKAEKILEEEIIRKLLIRLKEKWDK